MNVDAIRARGDGRLWTGRRFVEALVLRDGRVVAAGDWSEVEGAVGADASVLEVDRGVATPGLHDAHTHLLGGALARADLELYEVEGDAGLAAAVRARLEEVGTEGWVCGRGWDADRFPEGRWPERAGLDAVAPTTPVLLRRRDGHAAIVNAEALRRAGITRDTPDPAGGVIVRDAHGEPTGVLLEDPALDLVRDQVPKLPAARQEELLRGQLRDVVRLGITTVEDDPSYDDELDGGARYAALYESGDLLCRLQVWRRLGRSVEGLRAEGEALAARVPPEHLRFGLLKGYLDGSLGSRTALLLAPYADAPETSGVEVVDLELLHVWLHAAHQAGFQVGLHAIGDRAVAEALDLFLSLGDEARLRRHRVEHAQTIRPQDVVRMARGGVVASGQPVHLAHDRHILPARLGVERAARGFPWRSVLAAGGHLAFGTDYPVEPLDPLPNLYSAVTRRDPHAPGGEAFHPEECVCVEEGLRAYTAGAAYAAHREDTFGVLEPGYWADVAWWEADLFTAAPEEWLGARCVRTLRGGEVVFEG